MSLRNLGEEKEKEESGRGTLEKTFKGRKP